jgi:hypothetical protein
MPAKTKTTNIQALSCYLKGRHFPEDLTSAEIHKYKQGDAECLAQMYLYEQPKIDRAEQVSNQETLDKLNALVTSYKFNNEVKKYLISNSFLIDTLKDAVANIDKYFGKNNKSLLELFTDRESERLFVKIHTSIKPEEAIQKLDKFDEKWWFKLPKNIHNYLEFTLEFE